MKSWRARLALVLTMVAMMLAVSGTALADEHDEDEDGVEDVEISDWYPNPDDPEEWCVDVTIEYVDDTVETETVCEDID